jgi:ribA/ribD-fused uncharacterized protein
MEEIRFYIREEPYGFLSNFWRSEQVFCRELSSEDKKFTYKTNEHFYQSMKARYRSEQEWINSAPSAYMAMIAGRNLKADHIVRNWDMKKEEIMLHGLRMKFWNEELRLMLLWTGDALLIESSPTDLFWGGLLPASKNMLGKLLMQVRSEARSGCYRDPEYLALPDAITSLETWDYNSHWETGYSDV